MKVLFWLLAVICICGCDRNLSYKPGEKQELINEVRKKASASIYKELGLIPFGTGAQAMDQIKMLYLGFEYRQPIDIEAGRKLLVASVQKFADEINANARIRPYLNNYPFEPKNIEISIFIHNRNGTDFGHGILCLVSAIDGVLTYQTPDINPKFLRTVYTETYEEALQKVQNSHAKVSSNSVTIL